MNKILKLRDVLLNSESYQDIQSIVDNAKQQCENCTENDLLQAFLYYFDNDAFIEFNDM